MFWFKKHVFVLSFNLQHVLFLLCVVCVYQMLIYWFIYVSYAYFYWVFFTIKQYKKIHLYIYIIIYIYIYILYIVAAMLEIRHALNDDFSFTRVTILSRCWALFYADAGHCFILHVTHICAMLPITAYGATYIRISLSLSLSLYIYIYIY